ncbi:MerR family transcriptional regulator [Roseicyclus mahoneyensis]|uniref:MerR-like DNA binding protein n=1 Tax=Roseicyclus mahoneyensis TaxID=164332 RepID=A0A316GS00_9RHOB|nr:MerR family transcriptional regulator [Roseicyclus mahoneyensis]PWK62842.1 MerR-like DNA binding protein [Roseicyclus mahoneyensis]
MSKSSQAFRTIREVADWLDVAAHVLRFWESKFPQIKPVKRAGGRRYYRPADMELVGGIKVLLHDRGLTIRGVQKMIREEGVAAVAALSPPVDLPEEPVIDAYVGEDVEAWAEDALADQAEAGTAPEPSSYGALQASLDFDDPEPRPDPPDAETETETVDLPEAEPALAPEVKAPLEAAAPEPDLAPAAASDIVRETEARDPISPIDRLAGLVAAAATLRDGRIGALRPALVALRDRMRRDPPGPTA